MQDQEQEQEKNIVVIPEILKLIAAREKYFCTALTAGAFSVLIAAPLDDCNSLRGALVKAQFSLHFEPTAPVIRLSFTMYERPSKDRPDTNKPFSGEVFLNYSSFSDREGLDHLTEQDRLFFHFMAHESSEYLYTKAIPWSVTQRLEIEKIKHLCKEHIGKIPHADYDFETAKFNIMKKVDQGD